LQPLPLFHPQSSSLPPPTFTCVSATAAASVFTAVSANVFAAAAAAADVATVACLLRHSYHRCTACRHYTTAVSTTIDAAL
jgi:hypothetical protein